MKKERKGLPGRLLPWIPDLLIAVGGALLTAGAWCVSAALGLAVGGVLLIVGGVLVGRGMRYAP